MALVNSLLKFKFDSFADLPSEPGERVWSEQVTDDIGNAWKICIWPGGKVGGDTDDPWVAVSLFNEGEKDVHAKNTFILRDALGKAYCENATGLKLFEADGDGWGEDEFLKRSEILDEENNILVGGALLVDVHLQIKPEKDLHVPSNPFRTNMLKLLEDDDDDADVSFKVKRTTVRAHKLILKMNAPLLYDFCDGQKKGTTIPIKDTAPNIFRIILRYIYGGDVSESVTVDNGKDLIVAANRYNIQGIKLAAETTLVNAMMLKKRNVAEWLLFADAQTCPLLKEYATSFVIARAADFMDSEWTEELDESPKLMKELMVEMSKDSRFDSIPGGDMSVNQLRESLDEKGLDVDGTKSMLVSRLQESNKRQRTE